MPFLVACRRESWTMCEKEDKRVGVGGHDWVRFNVEDEYGRIEGGDIRTKHVKRRHRNMADRGGRLNM